MAAEQRSQPGCEDGASMSIRQTDTSAANSLLSDNVADASYQQIIQEHTDLMERALREDDVVLVPIVEAFLQRCLDYHEQATIPEQARRLLGHAQYWQAFLKALNQSLS